MQTEFGKMVEETTYVVETPQCIRCGEGGSVEVPMKGFLIRQLGGLIQDAYPDLDLPLREQLISGTHPKCWEELFGGDTK
jgi:hypothetical protein